MKDNFSAQAAGYARFRPNYPAALINYLANLPLAKQAAWDCGTGNGQVAVQLANYFDEVFATDISAKQLREAPVHPRIRYALEPGEQCSASDGAFDLIVVAQAIHWFDFDRFYAEVRRVSRPGAVLAVVGYGLFQTDSSAVTELIRQFYTEIVGPYWDPERRYLDEAYRTIPFPFEETGTPEFSMQYRWSMDDLLGYLGTWSAVQHYQRQKAADPLELIKAALRRAQGDRMEIAIRFPVHLRVGKL